MVPRDVRSVVPKVLHPWQEHPGARLKTGAPPQAGSASISLTSHPTKPTGPGGRTRTMVMQEPTAMRVDPTETTNPESFEELRKWTSIVTAQHHQPVWLVVNPMAGALAVRGRLCHGEAAEGGCGKRSRAAGGRVLHRVRGEAPVLPRDLSARHTLRTVIEAAPRPKNRGPQDLGRDDGGGGGAAALPTASTPGSPNGSHHPPPDRLRHPPVQR
jgi:hypothetical protein